MNFFTLIKRRIKNNPISSFLIFILFLIIITLAIPYFKTSNKQEANEELLNSITNPQNIPKDFIDLTEGFSSDQLNNLKDLTDKFSIEQIIELEQKIVRENFEKLDFTDVEVEETSEFLSGSISVKKKYDQLNTEYELLLIDYEKAIESTEKAIESTKKTQKESDKNKSKSITLALDNQTLKNKISALEVKVKNISEEAVQTNEENEENQQITDANHKIEIEILNDEIEQMILEVKSIRQSYKEGNHILSSTIRTGQSANFKFNWVELNKLNEDESRYLRLDLKNISNTNPYNFRLMNYLPTGSMIPLLTNDTLGLVTKTKDDQEFFIGDVISYVPPKYDDSIGDMEGCDISLESAMKKNYNHISHRIIDKRWNEEIEDWNYLPKGDQNALHDGCFITNKDIKYKLELLIKIQE